jgi:hypothetical protein
MKYFGTRWLSFVLLNAALIASAQNIPPVISFSLPSPQQVVVGSNLVFTFTVVDPEGITPSLIITNRPPGRFHFDESIGYQGTRTGAYSYTPIFQAQFGGPYELTFIASDGINPSVTNNMTIVVIAAAPNPITLTNYAYANGQFSFAKSGLEMAPFEIQASTNLIDWVPIATNYCGTCPFTDSFVSNSSHRFYRTLRLTNELIQFP